MDCNVLPVDLQVLQTAVRHYIREKMEPLSPINELIAPSFHEYVGWNFTRGVLSLLGGNIEDDLKVMAGTSARPLWTMSPASICSGISGEVVP